jgi:hypothetical protein
MSAQSLGLCCGSCLLLALALSRLEGMLTGSVLRVAPRGRRRHTAGLPRLAAVGAAGAQGCRGAVELLAAAQGWAGWRRSLVALLKDCELYAVRNVVVKVCELVVEVFELAVIVR